MHKVVCSANDAAYKSYCNFVPILSINICKNLILVVVPSTVETVNDSSLAISAEI